MKYTSPTAAIVAIATLTVARAQGFLGEGGCSSWETMWAKGYPSYVSAYGCNGAGSTPVFIDLNSCLANDGGNLVPQDDGGFANSCNGFTISGNSFFATCSRPDGTYVPAGGVDLNSVLSYYLEDGGKPILKCFSETNYFAEIGITPW